MEISCNVVGDSNDENNFLQKFLLTNTQFSKLRKAFANNSSANIKFSKTQFFDRLLGPLVEIGLLLIGKVLKLLAKDVLIPLWLTAAKPATDAVIHKKIYGSGATILIISNEEINDIMKIVKSLK